MKNTSELPLPISQQKQSDVNGLFNYAIIIALVSIILLLFLIQIPFALNQFVFIASTVILFTGLFLVFPNTMWIISQLCFYLIIVIAVIVFIIVFIIAVVAGMIVALTFFSVSVSLYGFPVTFIMAVLLGILFCVIRIANK